MDQSETPQTGQSQSSPEAQRFAELRRAAMQRQAQRFAELRRAAMQRQQVVRRSRIGRSGVLLAIAALALILLVTWRRDSLDRQDAINSLQAYINQAVADGRQQLWPEGYVQVVSQTTADQPPGHQPLVLAYNSQKHNLILLPDGRSVVLLDDSHVKADWMTHKELTAHLKSQDKLLPESNPSP